jgi:hypothetical protein
MHFLATTIYSTNVSDTHVDPTKTHTAGIKFNGGGISQGNFVKTVM